MYGRQTHGTKKKANKMAATQNPPKRKNMPAPRVAAICGVLRAITNCPSHSVTQERVQGEGVSGSEVGSE